MKSEIPKVLHALQGKPMIQHVVERIRDAGIDDIVAVVGYKGDDVIRVLPVGVSCVWQKEQRGTGHAVLQAQPEFEDFDGFIYVACGDVPLITSHTIKRMINEAAQPDTKAVVLTMVPDNPAGYGRVIRDTDGNLLRIVEQKDASDAERKIAEVNTGTYIFHSESLFRGLTTVTTDNAQGEYYLPDVFNYIRMQGGTSRIVLLENPLEGSGINSREELERLQGSSQSLMAK